MKNPYDRQVSNEDLLDYASEKRLSMPVAYDRNWKNLRRYWLFGEDRAFTSVSFLIDKKGRIRYIHEGGSYHREEKSGHSQCVVDFLELNAMITTLLRE